VRALVEDLARRIDIDRARIHATGHSNGGMMSYRLAVDASDLVASIVPVGGSMVVAQFHPTRRIPVLHIHSVDDPRALYQGGEGPAFPGTSHRSMHQSVESTLGTWAEFNGCPATPHTLRTVVGERESRSAGHTAELLEWGPCASGTVIRHWKLTGPGHGWPGATGRTLERIIGPPTSVIDAALEAWRFMAEAGAAPTGADR
jgi:polyhydroxybutyrate depolymerase